MQRNKAMIVCSCSLWAFYGIYYGIEVELFRIYIISANFHVFTLMKDEPQYSVKAKSGTLVVNFDNWAKRMIGSKNVVFLSLKTKQLALICYINAFSLKK